MTEHMWRDPFLSQSRLLGGCGTNILPQTESEASGSQRHAVSVEEERFIGPANVSPHKSGEEFRCLHPDGRDAFLLPFAHDANVSW
jgi:hypothetical protein